MLRRALAWRAGALRPTLADVHDEPVHRRTMVFEAYEEGGVLQVTAELRDERPWVAVRSGAPGAGTETGADPEAGEDAGAGTETGADPEAGADAGAGTETGADPEVLHHMVLRCTLGTDDMTISEAVVEMHRFPHAECPAIAPAFGALVGLSVVRGYTAEVQRRFGGVAGCTHVALLARMLGPAVVQAVASSRARAQARGLATEEVVSSSGTPWMRDSCHVWAEGGIGEQKLALGWRPGPGAFPARPLHEIRRAAADTRRSSANGPTMRPSPVEILPGAAKRSPSPRR